MSADTEKGSFEQKNNIVFPFRYFSRHREGKSVCAVSQFFESLKIFLSFLEYHRVLAKEDTE